MLSSLFVYSIALGITAHASPTATITSVTTGTIAPRSPLCIYQADPDNGLEAGSCVCSSGDTTSSAAPVDTGLPCPWTAFPLTSASAVAGPKDTRTVTTSFRSTAGLTVGECSSVLVSPYNGVDVTDCLLPTKSVSVLPHITVLADATSRQQVGDLATFITSGSIRPLYTSVSSALEKLCPTPSVPGVPTSCEGTALDVVDIKNVAYYGGDAGDIVYKTDGTLSVSTGVSNYTTTDLRDKFIESIAEIFHKSANNDTHCDREAQVGDGKWLDDPKNRRICTAPGYVELLYMDQALNGNDPAGSMMAKLLYADPRKLDSKALAAEKAIEACMEVVEIASSVLLFIFPEFAVGDLGLGAIAETSCWLVGRKLEQGQR